jgi:uncharacterized protein (TIGR03437 family)
MSVVLRLACLATVVSAGVSVSLFGQTLSNQSLTGKYSFRYVVLSSDASPSQAQTLFGSMTFDGAGGYTFAGQTLNGVSEPAATSGNSGTYTVQSGGQVVLSDPLRSGGTVNARLGSGLLVGSNTEAGNSVFSIFVALPGATSPVTQSVLNGMYWVASLEILGGNLGFARETLFQMTANGSGSFGSPLVVGQAANLGNRRMSQTLTGVTYNINADGTGTMNLPPANPNDQLLAGAKALSVSGDGSFFIGGSALAGDQGLLIGFRAGTNLTNAKLTGLYWSADLYIRGQADSCFTGSANALGNGTMTWSKRLRQNSGALDVTTISDYNLKPDGSGSSLDNQIAVSANGQLFVGSGLATLDTDRYELYIGVQAPAVSGTGTFLNPQGVFNVFSYGPAGNPIAPGEFITIFGTGLPVRNAVSVPFPTALNGVQLLINNNPVPLYAITATQVFAVVPYSVTGPTATIVLNNNGTMSNSVTVPVAATSPGVASVAQNGLGAGAITHASGALVTSLSPALRGETVVIYLTGLGAVTPAVADGARAPSSPLSASNSVQTIYLNGVCANAPNCNASNISFQGLTPGFAGLYQVNFIIPLTATAGSAVPLAIQTTNGFADLVDIAIR